MRAIMSIDPTTSAERPVAPQVAAVISASDSDALRTCLVAVGEQVYGATRVFVVGGDDEVRRVAGEFEALWRPNLKAAVDSIGPEFTFVWALREQAIPEPQALRVLVQDSLRVDASVAGSKVVSADDRERLVAVGYATDVFDAPYSGLQDDELDQSQYDVIRDVAAVSGVSVLIRRDLYRGLGGIDRSMAPTAAAIDFCQRARLRGARVVVVPGAVVALRGPLSSSDWRERAGELRAMLKAYSPITLVWAIPLTLIVGLIEGIGGLLFGRFPLPGVIAAWLWNIPRLPSAIRARLTARRGRATGDEELFRYQVAGSARLRSLWDETMTRIRQRFPEGILSGFADAVEAGQQRIRHPAFFVGFLLVLFALVATREIWTQHLPVVGFSLPAPDSATAGLGAYAGGWNPAGLGSPEVLPPSFGAVALVQLIAFGSGGLAAALVIVASFLAGAFGMGRLLRVWGIGTISGYLAGSVLMAGPAMVAATASTHWTVIPAFAAMPWAIRAAIVPPPDDPIQRVAHLAGGVFAVGVAAVFTPIALPVALVAVGVWALVGVGTGRTAAILRAAAMTALAVPLLVPWLLYADLGELLTAGSGAFWEPSLIAVAAIAFAALGAIVGGDALLSSVGSWGALLTVIGALVARTGDVGSGTSVLLAALVLAGFGVAVATAAALEAGARRQEVGGIRHVASWVALGGGAVLVVATVVLAGPGRAGIPEDVFTGTFDFAAPEGAAATRVLLFGPADTLPGESRDFDGLGYRVFTPPLPSSWEAHLNEPRLGDEALEQVLQDVVDGRSRRAGDRLADFGIAWIAFTEESPLEQVFESQLDLVALRSLDFPVFRNEESAFVAVGADGAGWVADATGFSSPSGTASEVVVATNADYRWGPGEWQQEDWANRVSASTASVGFSPHGGRRLAAVAAFLWLLLIGAAWGAGVAHRRRG
jgi:hypothetical protein